MPILSDIDTDGFFATNVVSTNWVITRTGQLLDQNTSAFASSGRVRMTVEGVVAGAIGIDLLQGYFDSASFITVTETGLVAGWSAGGQGIDFYFAGSELTNAGTVVGATAVNFSDGTDILVSNSGDILGQGTGGLPSIGIQVLNGTGGQIFNSGLIEGDIGILLADSSATIRNDGIIRGVSQTRAAIEIGFDTSDPIDIRNTGSIEGAVAISAPVSAMNIFNEGVISGDVTLSDRPDVFRGGDGLLLGELRGGNGNDRLISGRGDDIVFGENGNDTVRGGAGEDALSGDGGKDLLSGGTGDDTLSGGRKADIFVFRPGGGDDVVTDFGLGSDLLDLQAYGFDTFDEIRSQSSNTPDGLLIDLTTAGGGTILLEGFVRADFDESDVLA